MDSPLVALPRMRATSFKSRLSGRRPGPGNHAGTIRTPQPPGLGKVAHHGEVAGREPRRNPFATGQRFVFRHAMLSARIQRQGYWSPLCDESLDAAAGLGARCFKIILT